MNLMTFNIQTIPDIEGGRRIYGLESLTDKEVSNVMFHKRRQETGTEQLRLHLHRIVAISVVLRTSDGLQVFSPGSADTTEKELLEEFYELINTHQPEVVCWDAKNLGLPVLQYRSMVNSVVSPGYWQQHHQETLDLVATLSGSDTNAQAPLHELARLMGFPGQLNSNKITSWDSYRAGDMQAIRDKSETDVLNAYLVYLRFAMINASLTEDEYRDETGLLENVLQQSSKPHLEKFLNAWQR